jgi:GAF domain-containing protein
MSSAHWQGGAASLIANSHRTTTMKHAAIPQDEHERIADLNALHVDPRREPRFDRLTDLIADVFEVPMVFLSLIEGDQQRYKSTCGINVDASPRATGFCSHAILETGPMVVSNAAEDPRFADNPNVTGDLHVRFYAGVPLHGPAGKAVGAIGLVDIEPREFSPKQIGQLEKFAALVEAELRR